MPLSGCPLGEKISEAHLLKRTGNAIAALAMIMIDNPLCAGTGHRICNDCMKSCIFQKQTPVDIPQAETRILTDVLNLPYGFEIYSLLTRWNALNIRRPWPAPYNGKKVLVVGMGPAGYTLAHYLLNEGFGVIGIEGLKVEPLSKRMRGAKRRVPQPIQELTAIVGPLDERTILGFGGVSEYGITVRWDKNFLDINYIVLMRRKKFRMFSGVRFGGTLTIDDCWRLGFDHIALATGAGRPTLLSVKNNMLRGVRAASDFLMGLQGTGIYRKNSLGNLQLQLPAVVIGGGLTAIDPATVLQAYYIVQVEKTVERYERISAKLGEDRIRAKFNVEEAAVLDTWLKHGREVKTERVAAAAAASPAGFQPPDPQVGRREHRVPQTPAGFARVPLESRRGHQSARRRHRFRRLPQPGRVHSRRKRRGRGGEIRAAEIRQRQMEQQRRIRDDARKGRHGRRRNASHRDVRTRVSRHV